jgi:hypothetical protein
VERRIQPRYAFRCEVEIRLNRGVTLRGILGDLSVGGCYVETIAPQPTGTPLELYLLTQGGELQVGGVVRHAQPAMGMGVEFVDLKPEKLAVINELMPREV